MSSGRRRRCERARFLSCAGAHSPRRPAAVAPRRPWRSPWSPSPSWLRPDPSKRSESPATLSRLAPNAVGLIDPETNRLVGQLRVGQRPTRVAVGEDAVWVLNADDRTISRVDVDGRRVSRTIPLPGTGEPAGLAAGEGAVWLGAGSDGPLTLSRINPSFNEIAQTMPLGRAEEPFFAARWQVAVGNGSIWTVGPRFGTVLRIDPRAMRIVARIDVGIQPATLAVGEGAVWAGGSRNVVKRINPRTNEVDGEWEAAAGPAGDRDRCGSGLGHRRRRGCRGADRYRDRDGHDGSGRRLPDGGRRRARLGLGRQRGRRNRVPHRSRDAPDRGDDPARRQPGSDRRRDRVVLVATSAGLETP